MQRRSIQLSAVLVATFAVAVPVRAEQADSTMSVGLRIVASGRTTTSANTAEDDTRSGNEEVVARARGDAVAQGERARIDRAHDHAGRPIEVVTY